MKILAIRGKNLASLEGVFEVDFRNEPLRSAGIFAITGTTGAGKSTILDAMCIALYETSPRLENVKNSTVIEKKGAKTVSENSAKTILRRGTHEGWAEVDFLAVNGNEYRVRWSVSRTNNSPDGTFRETSYDLNNITTGEYTRLTAKSHKQVIPELTGLSFEQFTRAVLLAQGNFAAFLKADESEKASILETLSGTEIYSLISAEIYRRYTEAKKQLDAIEEKKQGLQILSAEELDALLKEKKRLQQLHKEGEEKKKLITAKIDWIRRLEQLTTHLQLAENELSMAKEKQLASMPVAERLKKIDSIQDIRDSYTTLQSTERQICNAIKEVALSGEELAGKKSELDAVSQKLAAAIAEQEKANAIATSMQPKIIEAGRQEKAIILAMQKAAEQKEEITRMERENSQCLENIRLCKKNLSALTDEENRILEWIEKNRCFEAALPMFPSIIANIAASDNEQFCIKTKRESLYAAQKLQEDFDGQLAQAMKKEEQLNNTMSSEIATLRSRLVDGEPCPVCGSRKHEVIEIALNLLEEKELEKARNTNRALIEHLNESCASCKSEIDRLQSAIEIHLQAIENYRVKNISYLQGIENAAAILEMKNIKEFLTTLSSQYAGNRERLSAIDKEKEINGNNLILFGKRSQEIEKVLKEKLVLYGNTLHENENARKQLQELRGTFASAEKMQEYCNTIVSVANNKFSTAVEQRNSATVECKRLEGLITEKENNLNNARETFAILQKSIGEYLECRNDISAEELANLMAVDAKEIAEMRHLLEQLRNNTAAATTKVAERKRNINEHSQLATKPFAEETEALLAEELQRIDEAQGEMFEKTGHISAAIIKDEENNRLFGQYKDEYKEKLKVTTDWNALNQVLGSQKGDKLMRLVQGYTLDILLNVANEHLKNIAPRYRLERITHDKLAIKVIDLDVMSTGRSVHSLSGGETFLVSLALSLALSSISSNRMSIETLFIDEGFGSLDSETLKVAMRALEGLQYQGRKIGVISHLTEMLEQIPVKINVVKKGLGKSSIEIGNN